MPKQQITTLSESAVTLICSFIKEVVSISSVINDSALATNSTYSSKHINELLESLSSDERKYAETLVANLNRLVTKVVTTIPTVDDGENNTLYLYKGDGDSYYTQYMYINGEIVALGTTDISLNNYYTKDECDSVFAKQTDVNSITDNIGNIANLTIDVSTIVDAINQLQATSDLLGTNSHTHTNLELLEKFSEDTDGTVLYNGEKIQSGGGSVEVTTMESSDISDVINSEWNDISYTENGNSLMTKDNLQEYTEFNNAMLLDVISKKLSVMTSEESENITKYLNELI